MVTLLALFVMVSLPSPLSIVIAAALLKIESAPAPPTNLIFCAPASMLILDASVVLTVTLLAVEVMRTVSLPVASALSVLTTTLLPDIVISSLPAPALIVVALVPL